MKVWMIIILFSLFTGPINLSAETIFWDFNEADEKNISGFIIYRSQERLANGRQINFFEADQKADKRVIKNPEAREAKINNGKKPFGFRFYYVIPFKGKTIGTDFDEQIQYFTTKGTSLAPVEIENLDNTVFLSWESIPGIRSYRVDMFKKGRKGWSKSEITTNNTSTWVITEPGEWIFKVSPVMDYDVEIYQIKKLKID
jgi:hypothetical protein